jgi:hypothetical protein
MVSLRELKELLLQDEIEFMEDAYGEDSQICIDEIKNVLNMCESVDDIVALLYGSRGFDLEEAYNNVIECLMNNTNLNK